MISMKFIEPTKGSIIINGKTETLASYQMGWKMSGYMSPFQLNGHLDKPGLSII
jgi:hypothetical protein